MQLESSVTLFDDDKVESRFAELQITADGIASEVSRKVGNDEIISRINQSAESVQIKASKVAIEGAAIFTSGRLSTASLDNAYDANGSATGAVNGLKNDLSSSTGTTVINGGHIETGTLLASAVKADSGQFNSALIPNLSADKITSGSISSDRIKANVIDAVNGGNGQINADKIKVSDIEIEAAQITSGTINSARIPNLSANKITTGTLDASRVNVTNINADDIVAGIISDANAKNTWNLNTGVFTTTSGTIGGFTITSQSGGRDYLMSDWTTGGIDYRTWIRSATDTDAGDTWAFSTQVKKSAGAKYKGSFYVTSRGELNCLPYTSAGNVSGISLRVHSDGISMAGGSGSTTPNFDLNSNGIFIYTGAVVYNQPNLFVDTSTNKLCYTKWTGSSEKIKKDIKKTIEYEDILPERLYDVEIVQFKYKDTVLDKDDPRSGKDLVGFLIEDLDEKYPVAVDKVNKKDSKTWSWNNAYLIPPMLKLIQDQKTKIDELGSRLNKVEEANNGQRQIN